MDIQYRILSVITRCADDFFFQKDILYSVRILRAKIALIQVWLPKSA